MSKYFFPIREPFNTWSHMAGAVASFVWLVFLLQVSENDPLLYRVSFLVYGISVILMFLSSAVYHCINVSQETEELFRRFDHMLIYIVIAGTYTPVCAIPLEGPWSAGMLIGIWLFALAGVLKKTYWMNAPRWVSTVIYLFMGWVSVIIFPQLWNLLPKEFSYWIIIGGLFYTAGAVIYGLKKPDPYPGKFGFHEIWHLFVIGGAFSHYWAIYNFLPGFNS